jgi:hypothetical protein
MATTVRTRRTVADVFRQWLTVSDEAKVLGERAEELRARLLEQCDARGAKDEKGSSFLNLTTPVEFKDYKGRVKVYTVLKRERHLTPAVPTPDPEKAEELLKRLKLWISKADEKVLTEIGMKNPYITISIDVDPDAVAQAYFKGLINDDDYDAILLEQKESFQFRPAEK